MKKLMLVSLAILAALGIANAGAIKTWTTETLRSADLNSNFQHLHENLRGGTHTLIVNADVSSSAAISHSKMATPGLMAKLFVADISGAVCAAGTCTTEVAVGAVTSVTFVSTGVYQINFSDRGNAVYGALATSNTASTYCRADNYTATSYRIECRTDANVLTNVLFTTVMWDDNN